MQIADQEELNNELAQQIAVDATPPVVEEEA